MEIAVIIASVAVAVLCAVIAVAVIVTLPKLLRILSNVESASASGAKVSAYAASVSENVATSLETASARAADTVSNAAKVTGDLATISENVAANLDSTVAQTAAASASVAHATVDIAAISADIRAVSPSVCQQLGYDIGSRCRNHRQRGESHRRLG